MRLSAVTISGFRGFSETLTLDLSADVILVHGPNGTGKTSLFDAVLWAITGAVARLDAPQAVISKYAEFGEARVELQLLDGDGTPLLLQRRQPLGSDTSSLVVETSDERLSGPSADAALMRYLWPDGVASADPLGSLDRSLTRAVYLQQDDVTSFINDDDERHRFAVVGEIVGAGRIGELVAALERERRAWTAKTNRDIDEVLGPMRSRREQLAAHMALAAKRADGSDDLRALWREWIGRAASINLNVAAESRSTSQTATELIELISQAVSAREFRQARLVGLRNLLNDIPEPVVGVSDARQRFAAADALVSDLDEQIAAARQGQADSRDQLIRSAAAADEIAALARLALRHIEGDCPVCGQTHDASVTARRLNDLISQAEFPAVEPDFGLDSLMEAQRAAVAEREAAAEALQSIERAERLRTASLKAVTSEAAALNLTDVPSEAMAARIDELESQIAVEIDQLQDLRRMGERVAAGFARLDEADRAFQLTAQLPALDAEIAEVAAKLDLRGAVSDDSRRLHESLRELSESLVVSELERIEPLLRRIYASVDPHPSFKVVNLLADMRRGRGHMWTELSDTVGGVPDAIPGHVLSSSQLNVLAVVTFMAMNLSAGTLPLNLAALDDPLQSLDNVNLLGLADLLRRTRARRQLMVSTHDDRLAGLLERKLRPIGPRQRTTVITFEGWERSGPRVHVRDVTPDLADLRIVRHAS